MTKKNQLRRQTIKHLKDTVRGSVPHKLTMIFNDTQRRILLVGKPLDAFDENHTVMPPMHKTDRVQDISGHDRPV